MNDLRRYMRLIESSLYPNLRETPGSRHIVYHGSPSKDEFNSFDPTFMNSRTGKAHGAFFFAASQRTAMTYMSVEDDLIPELRGQYEEWLGKAKEARNAAHTSLNAILQSQGLPPAPNMNTTTIWMIKRQLEKQPLDDALSTELAAAQRQYDIASRYGSQALDLWDKEKNIQESYSGSLLTCELSLDLVWERDLGGDAFQADRWRDIFSTATQSGADAVVLYNAVDTANDFGTPDTIYAVFEPARIKIIDRTIFDGVTAKEALRGIRSK